MSQYPIAILSPSRKERQNALCRMFDKVLEQRLICVILKDRNWYSREANKYGEIFITGDRNSSMLAVTKVSQIGIAAEALTKISSWHKNSFVILIAQVELIKDCEKHFAAIKSETVPTIQDIIATELEGYVFPVDDELVIYGSDMMKTIVTEQ